MATNDFEAVIFTANEQYPSLFESLSRLNEYMISQADAGTGLVSATISSAVHELTSYLLDHYPGRIILCQRLGRMGEHHGSRLSPLRGISYWNLGQSQHSLVPIPSSFRLSGAGGRRQPHLGRRV
jgi:hypothetical protein